MSIVLDERAVIDFILTAKRHTSLGNFQASNRVLFQVLEVGKESRDVHEYVAKIFGLIGFNYFQVGDMVESRRFMEFARRTCIEMGDQEGGEIYAENIVAISKGRTSAALTPR
jgi:hypothetical protein